MYFLCSDRYEQYDGRVYFSPIQWCDIITRHGMKTFSRLKEANQFLKWHMKGNHNEYIHRKMYFFHLFLVGY